MSFTQVSAESHHSTSLIEESIDATAVPPEIQGARTLFSSFHHFPPHIAKAILKDAAQLGVPIGIFEYTERTIWQIIGMLFAPLVALIALPFLRPFSWLRFFLYPISDCAFDLVLGWHCKLHAHLQL